MTANFVQRCLKNEPLEMNRKINIQTPKRSQADSDYQNRFVFSEVVHADCHSKDNGRTQH